MAAGGWLGQRRRVQRQEDEIDRRTPPSADDDALAAVFARLSDAADVVRCAATCRRWCRVVAKEAAVLGRRVGASLPSDGAVVGLFHFHQEDAAPRKRKRSPSSSPAAGQPCFVPTAAAVRLIRGTADAASAMTIDAGGGLLDYARPVASRDGLVVLELRRDGHADGLKLCVVNPMTGHVSLLPPLAGTDKPGSYACALLTTHDDDVTFVFRVLLVYNRRRFTAFRAYSSSTGQWGPEAARSLGPKIEDRRLRGMGQAAVLRGVAYWPLRRSALAVRLDGDIVPRDVAMPPDGISGGDNPQRFRVMGVMTSHAASADDGNKKQQQQELCFIEGGFHVDRALMKAGQPFRSIVLLTKVLRDGRWEKPPGRRLVVPGGLKVRAWDDLNLRWFCERSRVVVFTVGGDSNSPGCYAINLATRELQKLAHGGACHSWSNVVGYEMDASACLASIASY